MAATASPNTQSPPRPSTHSSERFNNSTLFLPPTTSAHQMPADGNASDKADDADYDDDPRPYGFDRPQPALFLPGSIFLHNLLRTIIRRKALTVHIASDGQGIT